MNAKADALRELALRRRNTRWAGYNGIGDYHEGAHECDFVSPYSKTAHNFDASIFVLLQYWSSHNRLSGPINEESRKTGRSPSLPTKKNLVRLLSDHFNTALVRAACEFAIPQIEIVNPSLVICLGISTFNALRHARDLAPLSNIENAPREPFKIGAKTVVWCQAHTGAPGQNNRNRGGVNRVADDWKRMKLSLC